MNDIYAKVNEPLRQGDWFILNVNDKRIFIVVRIMGNGMVIGEHDSSTVYTVSSNHVTQVVPADIKRMNLILPPNKKVKEEDEMEIMEVIDAEVVPDDIYKDNFSCNFDLDSKSGLYDKPFPKKEIEING